MFFNQNYKFKRNMKLIKTKNVLKVVSMSLFLSLCISKDCNVGEQAENNVTSLLNTRFESVFYPTMNAHKYYQTIKLNEQKNSEEQEIPKEMIAITFDDGPGKYTDRLLDILEKNDAEATFFVVGYNIHKYPETLVDMYNSDNEIGLHSYSHANLTELSIDEINDEMNSEIDELYELGISPKSYIRPPGGAINDDIVANLDYSFILWSVDSRDWESRNVDEIIEEVNNNVKPGTIILFHDIYETTVDAIEILLPELSKKYEIVTVSELYDKSDITIEKNKTYSKVKKK